MTMDSTKKSPENTSKIAQLTKNDILSIIRACKNNGVKNLKVDGLELNLGEVPEPALPTLSKSALKEIAKDDKFAHSQDMEAEYEQMLLDDPEEYERIMTERNLDMQNGKDAIDDQRDENW